MSGEPSPGPGPAPSPTSGETTRRYTRSAVVRIRAAIEAAKGQASGITPVSEPVAVAAVVTPTRTVAFLPERTSTEPPLLPETTQRYSADVRARLRADMLDAVTGRSGPDRSAARFRLGEHQPRRMVPAPSIVLVAVEAHAAAVATPGSLPAAASSPGDRTRAVTVRTAAAQTCDLVGQEPGALLLLSPDGALHVIDADQVCAVALALVGAAVPVLLVDVVLDWGTWRHPASVLRLQPTAASLSRIYPGQSLADAVGLACRLLAGPGAATLPSGDLFPGPPWPRFADVAAFEQAWLALAPDEVTP